MINIDDNLKKILLIHFLICAFIYNYKPSFMFDKQGNFKSFGTGPDKTIYPFWLVTIVFSSLVYLYIIIKNDDFV